MKIKLGYFQKQALIERLVERFAKLNGYMIEPDIKIMSAENPRIEIWIAMAEAAIEEIENF